MNFIYYSHEVKLYFSNHLVITWMFDHVIKVGLKKLKIQTLQRILTFCISKSQKYINIFILRKKICQLLEKKLVTILLISDPCFEKLVDNVLFLFKRKPQETHIFFSTSETV